MERLVELAAQQELQPASATPQVCIVALGGQAEHVGLWLAEALRRQGLRVLGNCGGSLKSQLKRADRSGADYALLLGEAECTAGTVNIKGLRGDVAQTVLAQDAAVDYLRARLARSAPPG